MFILEYNHSGNMFRESASNQKYTFIEGDYLYVIVMSPTSKIEKPIYYYEELLRSGLLGSFTAHITEDEAMENAKKIIQRIPFKCLWLYVLRIRIEEELVLRIYSQGIFEQVFDSLRKEILEKISVEEVIFSKKK